MGPGPHHASRLTPRILVLGAGGMLGHKMFQRLRRDFPETFCTLHGASDVRPFDAVPLFHEGKVFDGVDVLQTARFHDLLRRLQPQIIVNCVGVIKQRPDAKSAVPSIRINALLPHELAEIGREWGGRVIHFSTDCVFSGRRGSYREVDVADADDLYGRTKFLGEINTENALTLRTSIIGRELTHHQSLLDWFLGQNHQTVQGFTRAIYSGVTTNHLADVVAGLIAAEASLHGVYQVASEPISKHDLLVLIKHAYGLDIEIVPDDRLTCDRSMSGARFDAATGHRCPAWPDLIAELAGDPTPYNEWLHYETV
jgi:dTDP-4-dehydrorhamnose reductase